MRPDDRAEDFFPQKDLYSETLRDYLLFEVKVGLL